MTELKGRQWISDQNNHNINGETTKVPAMINGICQRCNTKAVSKLPDGRRYCRECIGLGRIAEGDELERNVENSNYPKILTPLSWSGTLTEQQELISKELVNSFKEGRNHLIHAVTGAGKTEMLFKVVEEVLKGGFRIAIATPRIDVVDELFPRFQAAFENVKIGKYHGREHHEVRDEQFVICTTHQLLKFYQAFDLIVIDEVDSFPFYENKMLHFAAENAVKKVGCTFFLTATPDSKLLRQAKNKTINYSLLKRRLHQGLLPVPKEKYFFKSYISNKGKVHPTLIKQIKKILDMKKPLLIFVPRIKELSTYEKYLSSIFKTSKIVSVYAGDKDRQAKVASFRRRETDILLTTTILERGVTFKHVQVIVIAADDPIYNTPSLVQIAGRVGRSADDRDGLVLFCYHKYTKSIQEAMKQIRMMNR